MKRGFGVCDYPEQWDEAVWQRDTDVARSCP